VPCPAASALPSTFSTPPATLLRPPTATELLASAAANTNDTNLLAHKTTRNRIDSTRTSKMFATSFRCSRVPMFSILSSGPDERRRSSCIASSPTVACHNFAAVLALTPMDWELRRLRFPLRLLRRLGTLDTCFALALELRVTLSVLEDTAVRSAEARTFRSRDAEGSTRNLLPPFTPRSLHGVLDNSSIVLQFVWCTRSFRHFVVFSCFVCFAKLSSQCPCHSHTVMFMRLQLHGVIHAYEPETTPP